MPHFGTQLGSLRGGILQADTRYCVLVQRVPLGMPYGSCGMVSHEFSVCVAAVGRQPTAGWGGIWEAIPRGFNYPYAADLAREGRSKAPIPQRPSPSCVAVWRPEGAVMWQFWHSKAAFCHTTARFRAFFATQSAALGIKLPHNCSGGSFQRCQSIPLGISVGNKKGGRSVNAAPSPVVATSGFSAG